MALLWVSSVSAVGTGDCDDNGVVSIDELVRGVNIALGSRPLSDCLAADENGDGGVEINELVASVNNALNGITVSPTPSQPAGETPTVTAESTRTHTGTATEVADPTATATSVPATASATGSVPATSSASPSHTPTATATASTTATRTGTPMQTGTRTATQTRTATHSTTPTPSRTATPTRTGSNTATVTATPTQSATISATRTLTHTRTATQTRTATATRTITNTPTVTASATVTRTATATRTATRTGTVTSTVTVTATPSATIALPTPTATEGFQILDLGSPVNQVGDPVPVCFALLNAEDIQSLTIDFCVSDAVFEVADIQCFGDSLVVACPFEDPSAVVVSSTSHFPTCELDDGLDPHGQTRVTAESATPGTGLPLGVILGCQVGVRADAVPGQYPLDLTFTASLVGGGSLSGQGGATITVAALDSGSECLSDPQCGSAVCRGGHCCQCECAGTCDAGGECSPTACP